MQITVQNLLQKKLKLDVKCYDTILDVKTKIERKKDNDFPWKRYQQKLIYEGKELLDDARIFSLTNQSTLTLITEPLFNSGDAIKVMQLHEDGSLGDAIKNSGDEKWRESLKKNSKIDIFAYNCNKWYYGTVITFPDSTDKIEILYDDIANTREMLSVYDVRIQPHKSRVSGGAKSGGVIGSMFALVYNYQNYINQSEKHWRHKLQLYSEIDVLDDFNKWYYATIIDIDQKSGRVKVNYNDWSSKYDQWFEIYHPRIQIRNTFASGGKESDGVKGSINYSLMNSYNRHVNAIDFNSIFYQDNQNSEIVNNHKNNSYSNYTSQQYKPSHYIRNNAFEQPTMNKYEPKYKSANQRYIVPYNKSATNINTHSHQYNAYKSRNQRYIPYNQSQSGYSGHNWRNTRKGRDRRRRQMEYITLLQKWNLQKYIGQFRRYGWIDPLDWSHLDQESLEGLGLQPGDIKRFQRLYNLWKELIPTQQQNQISINTSEGLTTGKWRMIRKSIQNT
eukprot:80671_1